jgi:hypothetical protein
MSLINKIIMNPLTSAIIFAISSAVLIPFSTYFYQLLQLKFRNIMIKQLKHSPIFTLIRMFSFFNFYLFMITLGFGLISIYFMIENSVINDGFILIIPFFVCFIILIISSLYIDKKTMKFRKVDFGIKNPPILQFFINNNDISLINDIENEDLINFTSVFKEINSLLDLNLINPFKKCKTYFANPGPKYPAAYLWDSAFISGIWRIWDTNIAKEIMMPFIDNQLDNGHCPQTVSLGISVNSKITNPPLIAWSLYEIAKMIDDYSFFKPIYLKLKAFNEFLYHERCVDGMFVWKHSYESGIDNSPRFTDASEKIKIDISKIWAVDFNTWMVLQNDCLMKIAEKIGNDSDIIEFKKKRDKLTNLMNQYLWDEESGLYYDYDFEKNDLIQIPTIFSLFPMFAMVPNQTQSIELIKNIKNPDLFNTLIPFPTVAKNAESFMKDCWRGSVWINTSYVIIKSLQNYGENKLAGEMACKIVKGVANTYANEGSIYEFYDPDNCNLDELTRKKGNLYKQITLGSKPVKKFVGWSGLANTLLIEDVIGYKRIDGNTQFHPHFPEEIKNIRIRLEIDQFSEILDVLMNNEEIITGSLYKTDINGEINEKIPINVRNHEG